MQGILEDLGHGDITTGQGLQLLQGQLLVQGPEYAGSEYDEDEADGREIARG